jgi:hypothetical protein
LKHSECNIASEDNGTNTLAHSNDETCKIPTFIISSWRMNNKLNPLELLLKGETV